MQPTLEVVEQEPFNASTPLSALADDVTPTPLHYVRNHFPVPEVNDPDDWRLHFGGDVYEPTSLTVRELRLLFPSREVTLTMECAGNGRTRMTPVPPGTPWDDGAVGTATYTGVPLRDLLTGVRPREDVVEILFRGADRGEAGGRRIPFERSLPIEDALHPNTLLAWAMNGEPLPSEHGFPLRLVVPGWYGVASVKWLTDVEALVSPFQGYYQRERYTYAGEQPESQAPQPVKGMRVKSLIHSPESGSTVRAGRETRIRGRAWSEGGIHAVEVSTDGGLTWSPADLDAPLGPHAWRGFGLPWTPEAPGEHTLLSRATDERGETQPITPPWNRHGYGNNACVPVRVRAVTMRT